MKTWPAVAVSHPEDKINLIVANPTMIEAYRAGIPGNGKPFPDGSKIVKIQGGRGPAAIIFRLAC
jgi:hypothetical protein